MYQKILVPLDVSKPKLCDKQCKSASQLAKGSSDAQVYLLAVVPDFGMSLVASYFPEDAQQGLIAEIEEKLSAYEKMVDAKSVRSKILRGKRTHEILEFSQSWEPDLIVVSARRKLSSGGKRLLGSFSHGVADRASCTVMIVR